MHRFLTGDELGNIKSVCYAQDAAKDEAKITINVLNTGSSHAVQELAVSSPSAEGSQLLAAGFSNGFTSAFHLRNLENLEEVHHWKETRLTEGHRYIGLEILEKSLLSCTSNGALRLTPLITTEHNLQTPVLSVLPTRLRSWKVSPNKETFAYGGDEVDLSIWDIEQAFSSPQAVASDSKKRKRNALFTGEIWRAKNVQNDHLGLRHPISITSLAYITPTSRHLAVGTEFGNVRRYDTRSAHKPVSDWKVGKVGSVKSVHKGASEHELFISDHGHNLIALDLRSGQVVYGYKGISGAVTSLASSAAILASAASDRYVRIHSTFPPPEQVGQRQERKGEVLDKVFMKSTPTVIIWDRNTEHAPIANNEDDIWERMEPADDDSHDEATSRKGTKLYI